MKIKDGKIVKLDANEYQVGNFIFKEEEKHIKIMDINSQLTHRVGNHLNVGRLLELAFKSKDDSFLKAYATMLWEFSNIIPDKEFMEEIDKACVACVSRHKEFYGIKEDISKEEDDKILKEEKETREAMDMAVEELKGEGEQENDRF